MGTIDLLPDMTTLVIGEGDDKVITAGPFTLGEGGAIIPRTGKQLRFVIKAKDTTADADALLDVNSVAQPLVVYGVGAASTGVWAIDIRNTLPARGDYWARIDLADAASLSTDREAAALIRLIVKAV